MHLFCNLTFKVKDKVLYLHVASENTPIISNSLHAMLVSRAHTSISTLKI